MSWEELIGLLISLGAFLFLMFRGAFKEIHREQREEFEEEEGERFLSPPPPPKQKPVVVPKQQGSIVSRHFEGKATYEVIGRAQASRAHRLLGNLKSKKDMVILNEIIGRPKGL